MYWSHISDVFPQLELRTLTSCSVLALAPSIRPESYSFLSTSLTLWFHRKPKHAPPNTILALERAG